MNYTVYTAGEMTDADDNSVLPTRATWRQLVDMIILHKGLTNIQPAHPIYEGCDHNGIHPAETVNNDLSLILKSDGVLAYLNRTELHGTVVEMMFAHAHGIPIIAVIRDSIMFGSPEGYYDECAQTPPNPYPQIYNTRHRCTCYLNIPMDITPYWFVLNYICGYETKHSPTVIAHGDDPLDGLTEGLQRLIPLMEKRSTTITEKSDTLLPGAT